MTIPWPYITLEVSQGRINLPSGIQTTVSVFRQICEGMSIPVQYRRYTSRSLSDWGVESLRISPDDLTRLQNRISEIHESIKTRQEISEKVEKDRRNELLRKRELSDFFHLKPDVVDIIARTYIEDWDALSPDEMVRIGDFEDARKRFSEQRTKAVTPPTRQFLSPPEPGRVCGACDRPISANGRCGCST